MAVTEVAATRDPGPPSESWLILQRLEDLSAQVKDLRQDMKELRQDTRQELDKMSRSLEIYRRDHRVVLLAILGTWVTLFSTIVGLFFRV
ncbi:MAG: hypothetical protein DIU76_09935 [Bacillota bacterium]|nr:MAG: hypothetical protein DIU76_09935 [Bacillota bacterium]